MQTWEGAHAQLQCKCIYHHCTQVKPKRLCCARAREVMTCCHVLRQVQVLERQPAHTFEPQQHSIFTSSPSKTSFSGFFLSIESCLWCPTANDNRSNREWMGVRREWKSEKIHIFLEWGNLQWADGEEVELLVEQKRYANFKRNWWDFDGIDEIWVGVDYNVNWKFVSDITIRKGIAFH